MNALRFSERVALLDAVPTEVWKFILSTMCPGKPSQHPETGTTVRDQLDGLPRGLTGSWVHANMYQMMKECVSAQVPRLPRTEPSQRHCNTASTL